MSVPILRPLGLLYGQAAREAVKSGAGGWLAAGPVCFTSAELIDGDPGRGGRQILSYPKLKALSDNSIADLFERLTASRPAMVGLDWQRTRIMGIVNVTPDSFSDGGLFAGAEVAIAHGRKLVKEGADIVDIGGESTRPGAGQVTEGQELARIGPVLDALGSGKIPVSIDTRKAGVMQAASARGAAMLNDVSALGFEPGSLEAARESGLPVVLMHAKGAPQDMQCAPHYDDVLIEVYQYLQQRIALCEQAGLPRTRLIVDPGIGFGKTLKHNVQLLAGLSAFHGLGCPVLLGASRKRFIGELTGEETAAKRMPGSLAAVFQAAMQAVQIVRVHDVAATRQGLEVAQAIMAA